MTANSKQFVANMTEQIFPRLEEMGVDGCVITGYFTGPEGKQGKFSLMMGRNGMVAVLDGLNPLAQFGSVWCAPPREFGPPGPGVGSSTPPTPGAGLDGAPA
jgi:hypothetical protein